MRKVMWMVLVGLFFVAGNVQAHCGHCGKGDESNTEMQGRDDKKSDQLNKMAKELKFTDDQKAKVEAIMTEKREKKQQIMEQKNAAMEALHADVTAKMKTVLSEEQMKKWEAKKDKCPMCKDGKPCKMCKGKKCDMKGHCPDCKDGKPCKACKLNKKKGKN